MPCNYKNYPPNWKTEIRPDILKREDNRCKFCSAQDKSVFYVDSFGNRVFLDKYKDSSFYICPDGVKRMVGKTGYWTLKRIVLTIMHLDHNPANNDYSNLAAGCQKCHLNYDKQHHKKNAASTRLIKKGLQFLS